MSLDIGSLPPSGVDVKIILGFAAKSELLITCLMFSLSALEFLFTNGSFKVITHLWGPNNFHKQINKTPYDKYKSTHNDTCYIFLFTKIVCATPNRVARDEKI